MLSEEEQAGLDALCDKHEALAAEHEGADELPAEVAERLAALEAEIGPLSARRYEPEDVARGGAIVTTDRCPARRARLRRSRG